MITYFSGFAGIGGFDEGIRRVLPSAECIGYSEIDKHAIQIYNKHFPGRTNYGDITKIKAKTLPDFDIFCGGWPCQDHSIAGKRTGLRGARSGMFFEIIRLLREKQPLIVFLENVKGLLSSKRIISIEDVIPLLDDEIRRGTLWEKDFLPRANWIIFEDNIRSFIAERLANDLGCQRNELDTCLKHLLGSVLEKRENLVSHILTKRLKYLKTQILLITKKSNSCREEQMRRLEELADGMDSYLNQLSLKDGLFLKRDTSLLDIMGDILADADLSRCKLLEENSKKMNKSIISTSTKLMTDQKISLYVQEMLILLFILKQIKSSSNLWKRISSNLTKKEVNMYVRDFNIVIQELYNVGYFCEWGCLNSAHFGVPQSRERVFIIGHLGGFPGSKVFPLRENDPIPDEETPENRVQQTASCLSARHYANWNGNYLMKVGFVGESDADATRVYCLDNNPQVIETPQQIRRLTPVEAERLQGFEDNWTSGVADSHRYRLLGNAVTVPVISAIVEKIAKTKGWDSKTDTKS
jgi:site-specific DNA-cytosine methylase